MILLPGLGLDAAPWILEPLGQTCTIEMPSCCASEPMRKHRIPTDLCMSSRSCNIMAGVNGRATLRSALPLPYFLSVRLIGEFVRETPWRHGLRRRTKDPGRRQRLRTTGRRSESRPRPHSLETIRWLDRHVVILFRNLDYSPRASHAATGKSLDHVGGPHRGQFLSSRTGQPPRQSARRGVGGPRRATISRNTDLSRSGADGRTQVGCRSCCLGGHGLVRVALRGPSSSDFER